jgi:hypothetical protein
MYRLPYSKQYGIFIWGVFLVTNLIFTSLAIFSHQFFLSSVSVKDCLVLFENVLMIFEVGALLWLFSKFKKIELIYPLIVFVIFMAIWLVEFAINGVSGTVGFRTTEVFLQVLIVALCWWYLLELYTKSFTSYANIPFFWVVMGLLVSSTISSVLFIPAVAQSGEWNREIIMVITGISQLLSLIFYSVGFWKTKNWVLQNQID